MILIEQMMILIEKPIILSKQLMILIESRRFGLNRDDFN
jgi:hypothetical protein